MDCQPISRGANHVLGRWGVAILGGEDVRTFRLLKLHGSMNWYYTGRAEDRMVYYLAVSGATPSDDLKRAGNTIDDLVPFIIAPVTNKPVFGMGSLMARTWFEAHQSLMYAQEIYVIGYSFPETDLAIRYLTGSACKKSGKLIHVVNLKFDEADRKRYSSAFPGCEFGKVYTGVQAAEQFARDLNTN